MSETTERREADVVVVWCDSCGAETNRIGLLCKPENRRVMGSGPIDLCRGCHNKVHALATAAKLGFWGTIP